MPGVRPCCVTAKQQWLETVYEYSLALLCQTFSRRIETEISLGEVLWDLIDFVPLRLKAKDKPLGSL